MNITLKCCVFLLCNFYIFSVSQEFDSYDGEGIVFRVVNGRQANLGEVPYQIALMSRIGSSKMYRSFCGGTIVKTDTIVTAVHCLKLKGNFSPNALKRFYAMAGNLKSHAAYMEDSDINGQWRRIQKLEFLQKYHFPYYDFAVAITVKPYVFNDYVSAIPYSSQFKNYHGKCLVSGFGRTSPKATSASVRLLLAEIDLVSVDKCSKIHKRSMKNFICTSTRMTDVGKGDSGGPLVCTDTGDPNEGPSGILVGVVCGKRFTKYGDGSFFTRVSSYHKLIGPYPLPLLENRTQSELRNKIGVLYMDMPLVSYCFTFLIYKWFFLF